MIICILCKKQFDPQDETKSHTPSFQCQICKLASIALYEKYLDKKITFDTTDVCWDCDAEILAQHNECHNSVDIT